MDSGAEWPMCPRCDLPMLFRAQLPLVATSLVPFDDERLLLLFECHARGEAGLCGEGSVVIVGGNLQPHPAPALDTFDVVLDGFGETPARVERVLIAVGATPYKPATLKLPACVLWSSPRSIAQETAHSIAEAGGIATVRESSVTTLSEVHGGKLVPYDDGTPGCQRTTLPPLGDLAGVTRKAAMRGLLGGATPGYRDHSLPCGCGRVTRTAVRLLGQQQVDPAGVRLGPAVAQICVRCGRGTLHRQLGGS